MRLLNIHTLEFSTEQHLYAIASHRWDKNEPTFQDVESRCEDKSWYKIRGFAQHCKKLGIDWMWIDTCCIDKRSKTELDTAINSMFRWYNEAEVCLAYLKDVDDVDLHDSVWFRRGWTLQELLAPAKVEFLSAEWQHIGYKHELVEMLTQITSIPAAVLADCGKAKESTLNEVRNWMKGRKTTYEEDRAYCLLGILDIDMRISYGGIDAGKKAMSRLERKYYKSKTQSSVDATAAQAADEVCARFCWLAEQLEKLSRHIQSSHDGEIPRSLSKLLISSRALAAALRGYDKWHRRGSIDITLFIQCARSLTHNNDTDTLIPGITNRVERLSKARKVDEMGTVAAELLELLAKVKHMLDQALDLYSSMRNKRNFMPMLVAEAHRAAPHAANQFLTSEDLEPTTGRLDSSIVQGQAHQRNPLSQLRSSSGSRSRGKRYNLSLRFGWLSDAIWHIAMRRDQGLWQIQFATSRHRPEDSLIFRMCDDGDIEGMRRLIARGEASVLDCTLISREHPFEETLLSRAARKGHTHVCSYLLAHAAWNDRASEASYALYSAGVAELSAETMLIMGRLFVEQYGLELNVSLDCDEYHGNGWMIWVNSKTGAFRNVIIKGMFPSWSQRSIQYRFEQSIQLINVSAMDVLSLTGLTADDHRWTSTKAQVVGKQGWTILHFLAVAFAEIISWEFISRHAQAYRGWDSLASDVLKAGMPPHDLDANRCTAFMEGLLALERIPFAPPPDQLYLFLRQVHHYMGAWQKIIERAGLDFQSYIDEENALLPVARPYLYARARGLAKVMRVMKLDLMKERGHSMLLLISTELEVLTMISYPGEFTAREPATRTIFWCPADAELREGIWTKTREFRTRPVIVDTRAFLTAADDAIVAVIETTQDDTGIISLLAGRMGRHKFSAKRSHSSPPLLSSRPTPYLRPRTSRVHPWLPAYHLCPLVGRYRLGCQFQRVNKTWYSDGLVQESQACDCLRYPHRCLTEIQYRRVNTGR